tara:strand:- start:4935 stop:5264 length:330 start_codon:yes stop_codon:yes gene_type:complete
MANLLDTYNKMVEASNAAAEQEAMEKEAAAQQEARVEVLNKYASAADNLLAEEYGEDYTEDDVVELAQRLINNDIEQEEAQEKVAEYVEAGTVMARAFMNELSAQGEDE